MLSEIKPSLQAHFKRTPLVSTVLAGILALALGIGVFLSTRPSAASPTGLSRSRQAEADRLSGLAQEYRQQAARQRSLAAETARLTAQSEAYSAHPVTLSRGQKAEAARLTALAEANGARPIVLNRAQRAEADRLTGQAEAHEVRHTILTRGQMADAARLWALTMAYPEGTAGVEAGTVHYPSNAEKEGARRAREAEIARWKAMAEAYGVRPMTLTLGQLAEAARLTGLAAAYLESLVGLDAGSGRLKAEPFIFSSQEEAARRAQEAEIARWNAMAKFYGK